MSPKTACARRLALLVVRSNEQWRMISRPGAGCLVGALHRGAWSLCRCCSVFSVLCRSVLLCDGRARCVEPAVRPAVIGLCRWPDACCFVAAKRENRCGRWLFKPCPIPQSAVNSAISIAFRLSVGLTETPLMVLSSVSLLLRFARAPDLRPSTCSVAARPKCVLAFALTQRHDASPTAAPHAHHGRSVGERLVGAIS
jgi:hypothetical protein